MPGMKRFRRNGREEPVSLDDEMFRLLPEDADIDLDEVGDRPRGRARDDLDFDDPDSDYDMFGGDGDPATRFKERRSITTLLSGLVILVVVAGVVWFLVLSPAPPTPTGSGSTATVADAGSQSVPEAPTLPVVHAETDPYKVRPDDPGGMQVQNTDIHVYDRLDDNAEGEEEPVVEQLLPRPSSPVAPPVPASAPTPPRVAVAVPTDRGTLSSSATESTSSAPVASGTSSSAASTSPRTETPAVSSTPTPPVPVRAPVTAARSSPSTSTTQPATASRAPSAVENVVVTALRGPQVQLAAFHDRRAAEATWERLAKAHPDLLGPLPHAVVFADLGDLGKFYRLRAGPLASSDVAEKLCRSLKQRKVECLVVRE